MSEPKYVDGLYPRPAPQQAPDFVIGKLAINVQQFRAWMQAHLRENPDAEWINIDMTTRKSDPTKGTAKLDEWKPERREESPRALQKSVQQTASAPYGSTNNSDFEEPPF